MTERVRRLVLLDDGLPPCGQVLVQSGRLAVVHCDAADAGAMHGLVWDPLEEPPHGLPPLDDAELAFVSAARTAALPKSRPRDGETWDSPAAPPPDRPL